MKIAIQHGIEINVGFLQLSGCLITESGDDLVRIFEDTISKTRQRFADTPMSEHPVAGGARRLFKSVGIDPSRYRPSGEALVRRVLKNQALNQINSIVDINNICSMESLFPIGVYDHGKINGEVCIRLGTGDDVYSGIERHINIQDKLVSADEQSAFGSPIADSDRTKVVENTQEVLVLLYAPKFIEESAIRKTLGRFAELASEHAGARMVETGIVSGSLR